MSEKALLFLLQIWISTCFREDVKQEKGRRYTHASTILSWSSHLIWMKWFFRVNNCLYRCSRLFLVVHFNIGTLTKVLGVFFWVGLLCLFFFMWSHDFLGKCRMSWCILLVGFGLGREKAYLSTSQHVAVLAKLLFLLGKSDNLWHQILSQFCCK